MSQRKIDNVMVTILLCERLEVQGSMCSSSCVGANVERVLDLYIYIYIIASHSNRHSENSVVSETKCVEMPLRRPRKAIAIASQ
jgi:hypothetical protein